MRIGVPLVMDMTDEQVEEFADLFGCRRDGRIMAKDVAAEVRNYVLTVVQNEQRQSFGADVTIKEQ